MLIDTNTIKVYYNDAFMKLKCFFKPNGIGMGNKVILPEESDKYKFSVGDALKHISEHRKYYLLDDMIMYNVCLRDVIRAQGVDSLVGMLMKKASNDRLLHERLEQFRLTHQGLRISSYDVQLLHVNSELKLFGESLCGLSDIDSNVEASLLEESEMDMATNNEPMNRPIHVGELWKPYPCFDIYDSASENRSYKNYIVRDRAITSDDMERLCRLRPHYNSLRIDEDLPTDMLPMVYYRGEGSFMLVASNK